MQKITIDFVDKAGLRKGSAVIDVADTDDLRRKGLSKRASLNAGEGMFFDKAGVYWMKDVNFPLDILFLDKYGTILEKQAMMIEQGPDYAHYYPATSKAAHALELPYGWFDAMGLKPGDKISVRTGQ